MGSVFRWWIGRIVGLDQRYHGDFPLGTFLINISGTFVMGYLSTLFGVDWQDRHGAALNSFVLTGVLGGYATFSTMQLEADRLAGKKRDVLSASYLLLSVAAGLLAAKLGVALARVQGRGYRAVITFVIPVFVGGALGAMLREFMMMIVPVGPRGFPYDILVANLVAAILLGLVAAVHSRKLISDWTYMLVGVGVTGGLSTFSSFAYGMAVLLASGSWTSALVDLASSRPVWRWATSP